MFIENDEYYIKNDGEPLNIQAGCTNSENFVVQYKQIRDYPASKDRDWNELDTLQRDTEYHDADGAWAKSFPNIDFTHIRTEH